MAIFGPWVAYVVLRAAQGLQAPLAFSVFLAAMLGDWATYLTTAGQLALAFSDPISGVAGSFLKFAGVFAPTQLPLAVVEGLLTVVIVNFLREYSSDELRNLRFLPKTLVSEVRL